MLKFHLLNSCSHNILGYLLYRQKIDEYCNSPRGIKNEIIGREMKMKQIFKVVR